MYNFIYNTNDTIKEINELKAFRNQMSALALAGNVYANNCPMFKKLSITPDHKEPYDIMVDLPYRPNIENGKMPDYLKGFECYYDITLETNEIRKRDRHGNYYYEEVPTAEVKIRYAYRKSNAEDIKVKTTAFRYKYSISYVISVIDNQIAKLKLILANDLQEIARMKERLNALELDITTML